MTSHISPLGFRASEFLQTCCTNLLSLTWNFSFSICHIPPKRYHENFAKYPLKSSYTFSMPIPGSNKMILDHWTMGLETYVRCRTTRYFTDGETEGESTCISTHAEHSHSTCASTHMSTPSFRSGKCSVTMSWLEAWAPDSTYKWLYKMSCHFKRDHADS